MPLPPGDEWRRLNRANWDERVAHHLAAPSYEVDSLRAGRGRLEPIEEAEVGPVEGLRLLHLQCHFGRDSLTLAQRGAAVTGLDFSPPAIAAAGALARELGLESRARFVESDLYAAREALPEPASFDRVYVTWGTICWLPDIAEWARIVAWFLKPGGRFYFAEGHPAALVLDDLRRQPDGLPGLTYPYFGGAALEIDDPSDYADATARLANSRTREWLHPLGSVVTALLQAGLRLDFLHEHDAVPWRMFGAMVQGADSLWRWPAEPLLPLSYSLGATRA
jgi:SAM-dependent methyltransferase